MDEETNLELGAEAASADDADEFEYDGDGNVIIPDVEEEQASDDIESDGGEETPEKENHNEQIPETPAEDGDLPLNAENKRLNERYAALEAQVRDTLSKLGQDDADIMKGLVNLAAEATDQSPEEYLSEMIEKRKVDEAKKLLARQEFEQIKESDTKELKASYPELKDCQDIEKESWFIKFAEFRSKGLTAVEAYSAANPKGIRESVASAVKRQNLNDTKQHLRSHVTKGGKGNDFYISSEEMRMAREALPGYSDEEIMKIYKKI